MRPLRAILLVAAASLPWAAEAAPIAPVGTTDVTVAQPVLDFLTSAGIAATPIAPGSAVVPVFSFPITGGETMPLQIEHSGGIRFALGADFIEVSNFVVELSGVTADVFGSAFMPEITAPIFELSGVMVNDGTITADLIVNDTLNEALGLTFFDDIDALDLTGAVFGTATTSPAAVPLPASLALLGGSLAALVVARRRAA